MARELTASEALALELQGEVMPWNHYRSCPKCEAQRDQAMRPHFCHGYREELPADAAQCVRDGQHMHLVCQQCNYVAIEAAADASRLKLVPTLG